MDFAVVGKVRGVRASGSRRSSKSSGRNAATEDSASAYDDVSELYAFLTSSLPSGAKEKGKPVAYNFTKFLVVDGAPVKRYRPTSLPLQFQADIVSALKSCGGGGHSL